MHKIFCTKCHGLLSSPRFNKRARRLLAIPAPSSDQKPPPCHKPIVIANLSWSAAVHYGIIDKVPDEVDNPFKLIGQTPVVPKVLNDRLVPEGPRWSYA